MSKHNQLNRKGGQTRDILRRLFSNKKAVAAMVYLVFLLFLICFADVLIPNGKAIDLNPSQRLIRPNSQYWFGTDMYGRDIFARVIYGARASMLIGVGATVLAVLIGTVIGTTSAYIGGRVDQWITRILDTWMAIPGLLLTLAIIAGIGVGLPQTVFALAVGGIPGFARVLRAEALSIAHQEYMVAIQALGASKARAVFRHIVPNVMSQVLIQTTTSISNYLLLGATLSFLGLGAHPPTPEWGSMLAEGLTNFQSHSYIVSIPGAAIAVTALAISILGDALRDALDPRLKQ